MESNRWPAGLAETLLDVLAVHAEPAAVAWLAGGLGGLCSADGAFDRGAFFASYAGAGRRFPGPLGAMGAMGAMGATDAEIERLRAAGIAEPRVWSARDLARGALLLAARAVVDTSQHVGLAREAFQRGDSAERIALLRTLPLLPEAERFVEIAVEACRTHVQDVFEAIACENPFAQRHFSDASFNQLVLKALFVGVPLERILGWRERNNAELRRMVTDYAAERRAAGRAVPDGVDLINRIAAIAATEAVT